MNYILLSLVVWICAVIGMAAETVKDAASIARKLVDYSKDSIGIMATVYPLDDPRLPDQPFAMQEYYASCHKNGSLTLLFLPISRHSRNILGNPGRSASISITSELPAARQPRVSLMGNVTVFKGMNAIPDVDVIRQCYLEKHPDAKWWLPDDENGAHVSYWARFDPHSVYFVGGFGGIHYIGYIPLNLYQRASPATEGGSGFPETDNVLVEQGLPI
ncbi:hypothetical protein Hypma_007689 [Hypsizygus marmoreus]|uniref:CREG-like beta-barrel domain-containing protein n=1 Tax=Hypsizygus marmoreus TaxID=39966 RepID=A0A369JXT9_HYPMA|nr:hypothetical protein Hypma_007689 [Hypsizygus marmoreus]